LAAAAGGATLTSALTTLLNVQRGDELAAVAGLQDAVGRLRWKSALALGENNGALVLGSSSNEASVAFANDAALEACSRAAAAPCVVVMTDGQSTRRPSGNCRRGSAPGRRPRRVRTFSRRSGMRRCIKPHDGFSASVVDSHFHFGTLMLSPEDPSVTAAIMSLIHSARLNRARPVRMLARGHGAAADPAGQPGRRAAAASLAADDRLELTRLRRVKVRSSAA
jgi:hypothetical protein